MDLGTVVYGDTRFGESGPSISRVVPSVASFTPEHIETARLSALNMAPDAIDLPHTTLLSLPPEVRNLIFTFAVHNNGEPILASTKLIDFRSRAYPNPPALTRTCRQIREVEAVRSRVNAADSTLCNIPILNCVTPFCALRHSTTKNGCHNWHTLAPRYGVKPRLPKVKHVYQIWQRSFCSASIW